MAIFTESTKTLRWFLIILGLVGVDTTVNGLGTFRYLDRIGALVFVISAVINILTLYIGLFFNNLIQSKANLMINFFWFCIVFYLLNSLRLYFVGIVEFGRVFIDVTFLFIPYVIIDNIKRLSQNNIPWN
ncbi:MAG: hypothetical protein V4509_04505 [Patescibacteria group bacterium]